MAKQFKATLSRSPGRSAWAVIFRHPVRLDPDGKPGRRVRRGLGTGNREEAERLSRPTERDPWQAGPLDPVVARCGRTRQRHPCRRCVLRWPRAGACRLRGDSRGLYPSPHRDGRVPPRPRPRHHRRGQDNPHPAVDRGGPWLGALSLDIDGQNDRCRPGTRDGPGRVRGRGDLPAARPRTGTRRRVPCRCGACCEPQCRRAGICRKLLHHTEQRFRLAYVLGNADAATEDVGDLYEDDDAPTTWSTSQISDNPTLDRPGR